MTFCLLVYIYIYLGSYQDFVVTPQNCKNQEILNILNFSAFVV